MKGKAIYDDLRLEDISQLLVQYSLGNFEMQLPLSGKGDGIDAIIAGVNMLGEELKHVTYSRDSLNRIYNSIAEMLFVTDLSGKIEDVNLVACKRLGFSKYDLLNKNLFDFISIQQEEKYFSTQAGFRLKNDKTVLSGELKNKKHVLLKCVFSVLRDVNDEPAGILLIAEDVTDKLATDKLVIRTIIDTQEKERNRFATDLHDSLGQQLSGIRFYLSALQENIVGGPEIEMQYKKTLQSIDNALFELRDICFNLMPRTLENHTLLFSLEELASKFNINDKIQLKINSESRLPKLNKAFEIACFRIVQEFLNNALKHGKATKVDVKFIVVDTNLCVELADNGQGFNTKNIGNKTGMGLRNIKTRVESYYGKLAINSTKGRTEMNMRFPLPFIILQ